MKYRSLTAICVYLIFLISAVSATGQDYESMLAHSIKRWKSEIDEVRNKHATLNLGVIFLCKNKEDAESLKVELGNIGTKLEQGKWLEYNHKLIKILKIPSKENTLPWLRRQFFIGVSYKCDMDGLQEVKENGL